MNRHRIGLVLIDAKMMHKIMYQGDVFFLCEFFLQGDGHVSISTAILSSVFRCSFPVTIDISGKFFAIRHIAGFAIDQIFSIGISAASCDVLEMTQGIDPMAVFVLLLWSTR